MDRSTSADLLVIGGGIHGAGVAQAAAAAGYSVLLVEQREIAGGTSSRSSKLIHGGLRYLEQGAWRLVRESLVERELLLRIAPDLVRRVPFFIPIYAETRRRPWLIRSGLTLYALLAGGRRGCGFRSVPKREWDGLDGLDLLGLQRVFQYWDAQTDDRLLTRSVVDSAVELGAVVWRPARMTSTTIGETSCRTLIQQRGDTIEVQSAAVVNAAGPWANQVLRQCSPALPTLPVDNVQGSHLELSGAIHSGCYYLEVPADGRAMFVMPWKNRTLLGTTEHPYNGDPALVEPLAEEVDYLLTAFRRFFPRRSDEVVHRWAGVRVLPSGGAFFRRSRETLLPVFPSRDRPRVVSVFGGKLTGYRLTAEKVVKLLRPSLPARTRRAETRSLMLREPHT